MKKPKLIQNKLLLKHNNLLLSFKENNKFINNLLIFKNNY